MVRPYSALLFGEIRRVTGGIFPIFDGSRRFLHTERKDDIVHCFSMRCKKKSNMLTIYPQN